MKGEFELIRRIAERFRAPEGVTGIGDDCAVIPQMSGKDTLVSTDMLMEGSHFLLSGTGKGRAISARELGWKSAAVNLSDIAAMGGRPTGVFLSLALPPKITDGWMEEFMVGFKEICDRFGVVLLGGDTTASPDRLCINVTVLGECPSGAARTRAAARGGDLICVTGTLGDSAAGLRLIASDQTEGREGGFDGQKDVAEQRNCTTGREEERYLIDRHYMPMPRVEEGLALSGCEGVHAMMDVSDGIASDLQHILRASQSSDVDQQNDGAGLQPASTGTGLSAEIDLNALPLSDELLRVCEREGWDAAELAVEGGEDYELLFTMAPGTEPPIPCTVIGRILSAGEISEPEGQSATEGYDSRTAVQVTPGEIRWIGGKKSDYRGFVHF